MSKFTTTSYRCDLCGEIVNSVSGEPISDWAHISIENSMVDREWVERDVCAGCLGILSDRLK